ncbi:hypothetical protein A2707_04145 [Candidatus Saccharibacteria bacterium RIFCSPHIGHO2_01_FULL_45_15]|nr:MAG: hypothetical protein A2707_04145 [Candidatus Saccharibacteria bacterium RIFCSPHIGHO2_01_FULL_45_15]OGL27135.1 MAG: hypothetical protein A3C39_01045 [Candidatus Saccharibacteria bacterium RIFCSPHIGHO2_02_FULL_46_12]OGL32829.1 MAG: hypothetical protein A3E76_05815 [Candidatus Saccharibacteria bacterium RIFCSPHIGHO2_12_FULL_44_22]
MYIRILNIAKEMEAVLHIKKLQANLRNRHRSIEMLSIVYLVIPYVIFCLTWLNPWMATLSTLVIAWVLRNSILTSAKNPPKLKLTKRHVLLTSAAIAIIIMFWVFFSGVGGFTAQSGDYLKHNAIFHDLIEYKWPVIYSNGSSLSYYIGYYLPSAAFGKIFGANAADYFQLLWLAGGVFLVFYWLCRLTKSIRIWLALLLVGFSGMDIIGRLIFENNLPSLGFLALEWSTSPDIGIWQYSANATLLDWTPQHAIAGWIVTAMIIAEYVEKKEKKNTLFLYSLIWLTSPLIATWLGVFVFSILAASYRKWRTFISVQNIAFPLLMAVIIGSFFLTNLYSQPYGFIWDFIDFRANIVNLILFNLLEYGIYAALIFPYVRERESKEWQVLFGVAVAMLAIMPLFMYGLYNDQLMRGSIPALFILMVLIARMLMGDKNRVRKIALTACLMIGAVVPIYEIWNHLDIGAPKYNDWISIDNQAMDPGTRNLANQYYGDRDSFFFKYLAQ